MNFFSEYSFSTFSLEWLLLFFILSLLATLIIIPWIILRLPSDYFASKTRRPQLFQNRPAIVRFVALLIKNIVGGCLVLLGLAMLILPGQGMLTILIGTLLLDFPGKFTCERWLVSRKPVWKSVNWLRRKRDKEELWL